MTARFTQPFARGSLEALSKHRIFLSAAGSAVLLAGAAVTAQASPSTVRVSVDSGGAQSNSVSRFPRVSSDGLFVAFASDATNLIAGDTNGWRDAFLHDRAAAQTERVSLGALGAEADRSSFATGVSSAGRYVLFDSEATNLVSSDANGAYDVFLRDRLNGTTERVSVDSSGAEGNRASHSSAMTSDARFVAFASDSNNFFPGGAQFFFDVFVRDRASGQTSCVSLAGGVPANGHSTRPSISDDGRFVTFESTASDLVAGDTNGSSDIFVHDRQTGATTRVSRSSAGVQGNALSLSTTISSDGRVVAFTSHASNLVAGDTNITEDVFVHILATSLTTRVNVGAGGQANGNSGALPALNADGRYVAFTSLATNLVAGDTNAVGDVFLRDLLAGTTVRVSVDTLANEGSQYSIAPALSADGRTIAFESAAPDLVLGDTNSVSDVFVRVLDEAEPVGFCSGDGSRGACPCANVGASARGCDNSQSTGGASLTAAGASSLASDALVLNSSGLVATSTSVLLQGDAAVDAIAFGDGLRCIGGDLAALFVETSIAGSVTTPPVGGPAISARSLLVGSPIPAGSTRYYQRQYRDPDPGFCPAPAGATWNATAAIAVVWTH